MGILPYLITFGCEMHQIMENKKNHLENVESVENEEKGGFSHW